MTPEIIFGVIGVILSLIGAGWALLLLAGRNWEKLQDEQFGTLRTQIATLQAKVESHYSDMARLELKISESEKTAMRDFALKSDLVAMRVFVESETRSIQEAVKDLGKHLDVKLDRVFDVLDRKADKGEQ